MTPLGPCLAATSCISRKDRPPGPLALLDSFDRDLPPVVSIEERALELPPSPLFSLLAKGEVPASVGIPSMDTVGCWDEELPMAAEFCPESWPTALMVPGRAGGPDAAVADIPFILCGKMI